MSRALVNGTECTIYDFKCVEGKTIVYVVYPETEFSLIKFPVIAELIEVLYDEV